MAVFRVPRIKDYTIMSNHHLNNRELSLKAKGLLSLMLSLPESWDYTLQGLAVIAKDGINSIRSAVKELEEHGYLERHRNRNEQGSLQIRSISSRSSRISIAIMSVSEKLNSPIKRGKVLKPAPAHERRRRKRTITIYRSGLFVNTVFRRSKRRKTILRVFILMRIRNCSLYAIFQHWIIQYWKNLCWISLRWKSLRTKIARN